MSNSTYEILLKNRSETILSRILLEFNLPFKKYPHFGTWCYFLTDKKTVTIFDAGPKQAHNSEKIIQVIKKYFFNKKIKQILLSHYHFDHSQNAPDLQEKINDQLGYLVPIRISANDLKEKNNYLKFFKNSLEKIFTKAGHESWILGKPLKDNEKIEETDFSVQFSPGHTTGNVALVSDKHKTIIGGFWLSKKNSFLANKFVELFIDEDKRNLKQTKEKFQSLGYKAYFHHPVI